MGRKRREYICLHIHEIYLEGLQETDYHWLSPRKLTAKRCHGGRTGNEEFLFYNFLYTLDSELYECITHENINKFGEQYAFVDWFPGEEKPDTWRGQTQENTVHKNVNLTKPLLMNPMCFSFKH